MPSPRQPANPFSLFDLPKTPDDPSAPAQTLSVFDMGLATPTAATMSAGAPGQVNANPESNTLFGNAKPETPLGDFGAGLQSGARGVIATVPALNAIGVEMTGLAPGYGKSMMELSTQIAEGGAKPGVGRIEDLTANPVSWMRYVAGTLGETVPFVASVFTGAGAAGSFSRWIASKGVPASTRRLILATAPEVGAFATAGAIETGATARELYSATGEVKPYESIVAGGAKGALESLFPLVLSRQLGMTVGQGVGLYDRLLNTVAQTEGSLFARVGTGVALEGATEYMQEEVDIATRKYVDENYAFFGPDANSRRLNALVAGGIGGGFFSSLTPSQAVTHAQDNAIRASTEEAPVLYGADLGEVLSLSLESMVRASLGGLDATAGLATGALLDQQLGEVDLRKRGLFAAVIPGKELTFGSQDQAQNDADYYQTNSYVRLNPHNIHRGDITASAEDMPSTVNDPRVEFLDQTTVLEATAALTAAIVLKNKAQKARTVAKREELLDQAALTYRQAVDLGARVEPFLDGQIIFRDTALAAKHAIAHGEVSPAISEATVLGSRMRPTGQRFILMKSGAPKTRKRPGGRSVDLENLDANDVTAFPTQDLIRQVLSLQSISRKRSLSSAAARGIRFTPATVNPKETLRKFVNFVSSLSSTLPFHQQSGSVMEAFMKLVDEGLRLEVAPDTEAFAILRDVREEELKNAYNAEAGASFANKRVVKQRAPQKNAPRVAKEVAYSEEKLEELFLAQFHSSRLQKLLIGNVKGGKDTGTNYKPGDSPLLDVLRKLVKALHLRTDFILEIVPPGALKGGVEYTREARAGAQGGAERTRTVIKIDPWFYAQAVETQKPLTKMPVANYYIRRGGAAHTLVKANSSTNKRKATVNGTPTTVGELAKNPLAEGKLLWLRQDVIGEAFKFQGFVTREEFEQGMQAELADGSMVPVDHHEAPDVLAWRKAKPGKDVPVPAPPKEKVSEAGLLARRFNAPQTKLFTPDENVTRFFADFSYTMGKIITSMEWGHLTAGEQECIKLAYARERNIARSLNRNDALARVFTHPTLEAVSAERGKRGTLYNFEEWVVSNIARTIINTQRPLGPVQEFFQVAGMRLKAVIEALRQLAESVGTMFSKDPLHGAPNAVIESWVDRLMQRGEQAKQEDSFLSEDTRKAALASIAQNRTALNGWNLQDVVATPQKASSVQVRKLLEHIPKDAHEDRKKLEALLAMSDRYNSMLEWMLGIHQLADMNPHITGLNDYVGLTRAMENEAVSWATLADDRLREVQKLPRTQQTALWQFMVDLDQMIYLDQDLLKKGAIKPRWPTGDELVRLVKDRKLSAETFEVYKNMRKDYLYFISYLEQSGVTHAKASISDGKLLAERILEIQGELAQLRNKPYFPHMRFGKYLLTIRNSKREVVYFAAFDTVALRTQATKQLVQRFNIPAEHSIVEDTISPALQQYQGLPRFALQNVMATLGLDQENLTTEQEKTRDILEALALDNDPQTSFRKRLQERSNIPGFSTDGMRSYAQYFTRAARFVARMEYSAQLAQSIQSVRQSASPISKDSRTRIADYMQRHYEHNMEPSGDWATLRSIAFMWYFAFVPAAAFVNLTQLPLVTGPYLAGKFGDLKTGASVLSAINSNTKAAFDRLRGKPIVESLKTEAIEQAHEDRLVDDGYATELAAISHGSVLSRTLAGSKFARGVRMLAQWGTKPFAFAEKINRSVTFLAAYDLAKANPKHPFVIEVVAKNKAEGDRLRADRGWDDDQIAAYLVGAQAVRETQFEYSRWARPKLMSGSRGVLFMFKSYLQNMLYFMFKSNRGTQARFMLGMLATAGLMGLPGADDLDEVIKWLSKELGYPIDPELFFRRMVKEHIDGNAADLLLHGASRESFGVHAALSGLGIPSPNVDLSGSLSMGKLIPGLTSAINPKSASFTEMVGNVTTDIAGPALGVPFAMYQSIVDHTLPADDIKRWERAMPRALKSVTKSSRLLAEQRERDRGGATIVSFDPNDVDDQLDLLSVGLGFQPTKISRQWDVNSAVMEVEKYWKAQRTLLMGEFFRSIRLKDADGRADAIEAIRKYNAELPYPSLRINRDSLSSSIQSRRRELMGRERQLPTQPSLRPIGKDIRSLYPEGQVVEERKLR